MSLTKNESSSKGTSWKLVSCSFDSTLDEEDVVDAKEKLALGLIIESGTCTECGVLGCACLLNQFGKRLFC